MGQEIDSIEFSDADRAEFMRRVRSETALLKRWFDEDRFARSDQHMFGLEVEAWLLDKDQMPSPCNRAFLKAADSDLLTDELAQFNFEINTPPLALAGHVFSETERSVRRTWARCRSAARAVDACPSLFGIAPTVRDDMLQPKYMSRANRYRALSEQLMRLRGDEPLRIEINGYDTFELQSDHIMLEAACTSIQTHLQVNADQGARVMNASMIVSAPVVAATANSPFLYGKALWDETRIPVFEHAISALSFRDARGRNVGRVTFGTGYVRRSLLEMFLENLDGYPPLLPMLADAPAERMAHVRLHNGTVWRWSRPVIGFDPDGAPHLRIEHRAMPSGPTIIDMIANAAFYVGLTVYYASTDPAPEEMLPFEVAQANFYAAARDGLRAEIQWIDGATSVQQLILDRLIPHACQGLAMAGVSERDVQTYLHEVMHRRMMTGRTGAEWQRSYVDVHGPNFQALTEAYVENQMSGFPVHEWEV